ncbi:MAG: 1-(5-phosphoribosyl)-5-[(5-phosphoribosylamino)methylideneamino]imidazole-4-carboxamide isomerase [Bacteroidota bacterium]|nr:1-(5-phosphoribosyl)-5-[(5-phosphoribosylamino)methylideneamino]imidazole-4-carboxamide isomerase [Bacteroidota bacterium]
MIQPIPAIDLLDGRCVRLMQGRYDQVTVYGEDTVRLAQHWEKLGAKWLHVVDLDAARTAGKRNNSALIARMCRTVDIPVQIGGGLRTIGDIERVLDHDASRAILGTAAVRNPELIDKAVTAFGADRVAVGIDAADQEVRVEGWTQGSALSAVDLALNMESRGVRRIIYTDIGRDGTMKGPNVSAYRGLGKALTDCRITASGGVASLADVTVLGRLTNLGIDSVVVGRALYEHAIDPKDLWP